MMLDLSTLEQIDAEFSAMMTRLKSAPYSILENQLKSLYAISYNPEGVATLTVFDSESGSSATVELSREQAIRLAEDLNRGSL